MIPRVVAPSSVRALVLEVAGAFGQERASRVSEGIAAAATQDPLVPNELEGAEATACLLIAYAWEVSRLHPFCQSRLRSGLYQIRPPNRPRTTALHYQDPLSSSLLAIDLIRESVRRSSRLPGPRRLSWILELGEHDGPAPAECVSPRVETIERSERVTARASSLFRAVFGIGPYALSEMFRTPLLDDGAVVLEVAS